MLEKFPLLISIAFPPKVRLVNMDLFYTFVGFVATLLGEMSIIAARLHRGESMNMEVLLSQSGSYWGYVFPFQISILCALPGLRCRCFLISHKYQ